MIEALTWSLLTLAAAVGLVLVGLLGAAAHRLFCRWLEIETEACVVCDERFSPTCEHCMADAVERKIRDRLSKAETKRLRAQE